METLDQQAQSWTMTPSEALSILRSHPGPLVVDLDETLYLRNSTEDFIGRAAPGTFGRLAFKALDLLQPWRLTGGRKSRDAWRVGIASLFPFAMRRWRNHVADRGDAFLNGDLAMLLRERKDAVIATLGFEPIVRPLLAALRLDGHRIVACRMASIADRRAGKGALLDRELGADMVAKAAVITDSRDDDDVLARCAKPMLVRWADAEFVPAHAGVYLPFEYISRVKRPNLDYVRKSILGDDYMLWLVASIALATYPIHHAVGLLLLVASFWTVYELGYVDNDWVGERFEAAPVLTEEYRTRIVAVSAVGAWVWALGLGAAGVAVLERSLFPPAQTLSAWAAVLFATYALYLLYNRLDKETRVWLYGGLQLGRACAFLVVVPVSMFGAIALAAHAVSRWILYLLYRVTRQNWPDVPTNVVRLFLYVMCAVPLAAQTRFDAAEIASALLILAWFGIRAGPRLLSVAANARFIVSVRQAPEPLTPHSERGAPPSPPATSPSAASEADR